MVPNLSIGTRTSPLAIRQVEEVLDNLKKFYPHISVEVVGIDTYGDKDKATPISEVEGSDFFTREIDLALLEGKIDAAVHSAKDLPDEMKPGLTIAAITRKEEPYDALVSKSGLKLEGLPIGAKIGTSSKRRKEALKRFRPDLEIVDIRGNIEERLELLDSGKLQITNYKLQNLDGIVVAACALMRLGLEDRITQRIPFDVIMPHSLQGALSVIARTDDKAIIDLFSKIDMRRQ